MRARLKMRLGELLVKHKVIPESQLETALQEQKKTGRKLGRVLIDLGYVSEEQLTEFLGEQLQLDTVDLRTFKFEPETVRKLPEIHARRYRAIVLKDEPSEVTVGMVDPTDIYAYDELSRLLKKPLRQVLVREADLLRAVDTVYRRTEEIYSLAEELQEELQAGDYDLAQLLDVEGIADTPVAKLLQSMFEDAVQVQASDIHIEPDETVLRIRQRVDGVLQEQVIEEKRIISALVTRLKLMSSLDISEKRLPQDGRFNIRVKQHSIDVRISTMPIQYGESVVMRLLSQSAAMLRLPDLGMPADILERFRRVIRRPYGMMLITGPTGSGKTTTLYAAMAEINKPGNKIITVEDPIEYRLSRINQVQVNPRIGLDFARVLRSALRQDPDVIMVGEIRDHDTAEIALRSAMTGHMVFSTLHTNDAIATVDRLLDMGAPGYLVASALDAVVAQRLLRKVCDMCSEPYRPDERWQAWLVAMLGREPENMHFVRGAGCAYCNHTGYRGRIGVYELLEIDAPLVEALRRNDSQAFAAAALQQQGYRPVVLRGLDYVAEGVTTLDEVVRVCGGSEELPSAPTPDGH